MRLSFAVGLADETLWSLVGRMAHVNGFEDARTLLGALQPGQVIPSVLDAKIDFPSFVREIGDGGMRPAKFVHAHTALRGQATLGEIEADTLVRVSDGHLKPTLGELTFLWAPELRYCCRCATVDVSTYGYAYWRKVHQIPVVLVCPDHEIALTHVPMARASLHARMPTVDYVMAHRTDGQVVKSSNDSVWLEIAKSAAALGRETIATLSSAGGVLREELSRRGYIDRRGRPTNAMRKDFLRFTQIRAEGGPASQTDFLQDPRLLLRGLTDPRQGVPYGRLLLVHWLFADWHHFVEVCKWRGVIDAPMNVSGLVQHSCAVLVDFATTRDNHRRRCVDYVNCVDSPTRVGFQRACQRAFTWLLHNDSRWLHAQLPIPLPGWEQLDLI